MQPNQFFFYFLSITALLLVHSQPCPSGETEVTTKTHLTCDKCSPGRYIPTGGLTCKECPIGYYQSLHGQSRCDIKSCQATQFKNSNRSKTGSVVGTSLEKTFIACNAGYSGGGEIMCQSTVGNTLQQFTRVTCERNDDNVRRITNEIKTPSRSPSPLSSNATIMETKSRTDLSKEALYGLISGGVGLFVIAGFIFFVVHHHNEIKHKKHVKRLSASREALGTGTGTKVKPVSTLRPSRSGWGGTRLSKEALELFDDDGTQLPCNMLERTKSGKFDL